MAGLNSLPAQREIDPLNTVTIPWKKWSSQINCLGGAINLERLNNVLADRIAKNIANWIKKNTEGSPVMVWNHDISFYQTILRMTQVKLWEEGIELIIRDTSASLEASNTNLRFSGRVHSVINA